MAMGNNPMMYIDADGKTWNPFKAIGQALDYAWGKANQFAQWADQVGIPSVNIGYGMSSSGQIQPVGDINGHPLFSNESQYEAASQNAVNAINDARGEYFSQQNMHRGFEYLINNKNRPVKGTDAFSYGFTIAFSTPFKKPLNGGIGLSMGKFTGSTTRGIYVSFLKGNGAALSASLDATYYSSLTDKNITLQDLAGKGNQLDFGAAFLGYSLSNNGYLMNSHKYVAPTYKAHTLSVSDGMDIGYSDWESKTYVIPTIPWIGLLIPKLPRF